MAVFTCIQEFDKGIVKRVPSGLFVDRQQLQLSNASNEF